LKSKLNLFVISILMSGCATTVQHPTSNTHWTYTGHEGPENWGNLSPKYSTCSQGVNQSPINLSKFISADLAPLELAYQSGGYEVVNNGHTIQVNYQPGSKLSVNDHYYELKQFHFHTPSENHISGKSYPMEVHFVHADTSGNLAVVAVMFEEGKENKMLKEVWNTMPALPGIKKNLADTVSVEGILPFNRDYYRFNGSLTTPPCSEGVLWLVMKQPITVTKEQIQHYTQIMHQPTNRPIQPVNARPVLE